MRVLFCDSVIDRKQVEPDFEEEYKSASSAGFETSLVSFEALLEGNVTKSLSLVRPSAEPEKVIYRGWMLTPTQYALLFNGLKVKNIHLVNSPIEYRYTHFLPEWYSDLRSLTPLTRWTQEITIPSAVELAQSFDNEAIMLKDFVKSEKHHWEEACYIPNASDAERVKSVVTRFLELRGDALNEGLVFRKFESLEYLTDHSKSGMPLTLEYRLFFAKGKLLGAYPYWEEGEYNQPMPDLTSFLSLAKEIRSDFFTMDIAKKLDQNIPTIFAKEKTCQS